MNQYPLTTNQLRIFKAVCKGFASYGRRTGLPKFNGRKLYDVCSQALGFKNYTKLSHSCRQSQVWSDSDAIIQISLALRDNLYKQPPFSDKEHNSSAAGVSAAFEAAKECGVEITISELEYGGHYLGEWVERAIITLPRPGPIIIDYTGLPTDLINAIESNHDFQRLASIGAEHGQICVANKGMHHLILTTKDCENDLKLSDKFNIALLRHHSSYTLETEVHWCAWLEWLSCFAYPDMIKIHTKDSPETRVSLPITSGNSNSDYPIYRALKDADSVLNDAFREYSEYKTSKHGLLTIVRSSPKN